MDAEMTNSGLMMGTPSYMSPEQAMGDELDGRTDIFSLGVVAFEMLSGQQPFPGNNVTSILYKLVHSDPVHPDDLEVLGLLPDKWHQVFSRVLSKDPAERFPTAADFVEQLEHCLGSWFGALEGETVIVTDPANFFEAGPKASGDDNDETVMLPASSPKRRNESVDGATATLERSVLGEDDSTATVTNAPLPVLAGEETVYVSEPGSEAEETLYAGSEVDETLVAVDAADKTLLDKNNVAGVAGKGARGPSPDRKKLALAGGAAVVIVLGILVAIFLAGGRGEPLPDPVVPTEPPPVDVIETGSLSIMSEPDGASVVIDGEQRGTTPLTLEQLPLGKYELLVEHQGFHSEELTAELSTDAPDATLEVALRAQPPAPPPPARVRIVSTPPGAQVEIDGRDVGATPTEPLQVRAGERTIRIVSEGFLPWEDTVRARSGRTVDVNAVLTERVGEVATTEEPPPVAEPPRVEVGELVERGGAGVENPECIQCPAVGYPERARRDRLEGVVELSFVIDETGAVTGIEVRESGGAVFDEAVIDAVGRWRWDPATKYGVPVKIRWVQRFRFRQGR
jgi:TonB family protein